MIRVILFRINGTGDWIEGVMHSFTGDNAVVENKATHELQLVPVKPENLKFQVSMEQWIAMQREAQIRAQRGATQAGPAPR